MKTNIKKTNRVEIARATMKDLEHIRVQTVHLPDGELLKYYQGLAGHDPDNALAAVAAEEMAYRSGPNADSAYKRAMEKAGSKTEKAEAMEAAHAAFKAKSTNKTAKP